MAGIFSGPQQQQAGNLFGNIQGASISSSGPKLPEGFVGVVEIVSTVMKQGFYGLSFIAELVVHESNHHEAPVGYRPSWTANMKHANSEGNILCLIGAANGFDPKTQEAAMRAAVTQQVALYCVSEHQPLRGRFVEVSTEEIKTKGNNDFTVHRFSPTQKKFTSRINDAPVGAPSVQQPAAPQGALPMMPGGFAPPQMPGGFAPPALPSSPMPGAPPTMQAPQGFAPPMLPSAPMGGAPAAPQGFAPPAMPGAAPWAPPTMQLPPLPTSAPMAPPPVQPPPIPQGLPIGWKQHPADPNWAYLESNPATMKTVADLRAGR